MGSLLFRVSILMRGREIPPDHFCRDVLLRDSNAASHLAKAPESVVTAYAEAINRCYFFFREELSTFAYNFLVEQELPVMRLLLKGMYPSSYQSMRILRGIQSLLTSLLQTQNVKRIRATLKLVIAIQTGGDAKLEPCDAWAVLQGIRRACEQRYKFLCCGRVYSDNYKLAIKAEPQLHELFREAERVLKT